MCLFVRSLFWLRVVCMDDKLESKVALLVSWFIPLAVLMFGFYRFALKPNVWIVVVMCIACIVLGWLLCDYLGV